MPRKLKEIEAEEVSIVDKAANKTKFFITKRSKLMEEFIKKMNTWFGEGVLTEEEIAKVKELPAETVEAAKSALDNLSEFKDDYPEDYLNALNVMVKGALVEREITTEGGDAEFDIEKATEEQFSKATLKQLRKLKEIVDKLLTAKESTAKSDGDEKLSDETIAKLEKLEKLEREEKERLEKEAADERKKTEDEMKKLQDDVAALKKARGVKKSLDGQEGDKDKEKDDEKAPKWASLTKGQAEAQ